MSHDLAATLKGRIPATVRAAWDILDELFDGVGAIVDWEQTGMIPSSRAADGFTTHVTVKLRMEHEGTAFATVACMAGKRRQYSVKGISLNGKELTVPTLFKSVGE